MDGDGSVYFWKVIHLGLNLGQGQGAAMARLVSL